MKNEMRLHKRLISVLLVLIMLLALSISAFAVSYTGDEIRPGLSDIQPNDTLTLPKNTIWATLTATWGVRIIFLDWEDNEITNILVKEGGNAGTPTPPTREGYSFVGWSRVDNTAGSAALYGDVVGNVYGPGPLVYKANYYGVLADGQTNGTITVINTTHGNEYAGYKIFDAEINPGNVDAIIYTITEDSPWYEFVQEFFELTEFREEPGEGEEVITIYKADPKEGFDPKTFFENLPTDGVTPDLQVQVPDRDGVISWDEVPFGYYAITSTLGAWVTVNTNNPFATVIDKNQSPQLDKNIVENGNKVKTNSASFGDSVKFEIEVKASNYKATELVTYYHIKDTISNGFDYDFSENSNVAVTVTGTQEPVSTVRLSEVPSLGALAAADSGYVFLYDESNPRSFEVIVKWATLNSVGKLMPIRPDEWNFIDVTYSATVNNGAVIAGEGNPNTASFTYDKSLGFDPEDPPTEEPVPGDNPENPGKTVTTVTYVYALGIEKVDEEDNTKHLPGVKFTTADFRAKKLSDGVYEVIPDEIDGTEEATEYFEIPESGFILIKGLSSGEYTFYETETLPGYNLLAEPLVITVPASGETVGIVAETPCATISLVENSAGIVLPSTGGIGTTIFYVLGGILLVGAAVLLITKKRMSSNG